jgi:hypothetical protein
LHKDVRPTDHLATGICTDTLEAEFNSMLIDKSPTTPGAAFHLVIKMESNGLAAGKSTAPELSRWVVGVEKGKEQLFSGVNDYDKYVKHALMTSMLSMLL